MGAMVMGTIVLLVLIIGGWLAQASRKDSDGTYGLAKQKARLEAERLEFEQKERLRLPDSQSLKPEIVED